MKLNKAYHILEIVSTSKLNFNDIEHDIKFLIDRYSDCHKRIDSRDRRQKCIEKTLVLLNSKIKKLRNGMFWEKVRMLFQRMIAFFIKGSTVDAKAPVGDYVYLYLQDYDDADFIQIKIKEETSDKPVGLVLKSLEKSLKKQNSMLIAFKQLPSK